MINAARVVAQEPEHPAPQNSGARSNSWTGLHLSSPPQLSALHLLGPASALQTVRQLTLQLFVLKTTLKLRRSNFGQSSLALQAWRSHFGAQTLALQLWRSNLGAPTLAIQPWRSNFGAPTLALQPWRSNLAAQRRRSNSGAQTLAS